MKEKLSYVTSNNSSWLNLNIISDFINEYVHPLNEAVEGETEE